MTKRLDHAIARVRELPPERQNEAADLLMSLADTDPAEIGLTPEQIAEVESRLAAPDETASHAEVRAFFRRAAG